MNSGASWEPEESNGAAYIEVRFPFQRKIRQLQIAGHPTAERWVTYFYVRYQSFDDTRYYYVTENETSTTVMVRLIG